MDLHGYYSNLSLYTSYLCKRTLTYGPKLNLYTIFFLTNLYTIISTNILQNKNSKIIYVCIIIFRNLRILYTMISWWSKFFPRISVHGNYVIIKLSRVLNNLYSGELFF